MQATPSEFTAESLEHLEVEIGNKDRILPYARNPRRHDEAVDQRWAWLLEYGLKLPLLVRGDGEWVDGHLRWKAATKLGFQVVPLPAARNPLVTSMAAELSGSCLDVDNAPRHIDVTVPRGEHRTGRTTTPDGVGRSFAAMARLRHPALAREGRAQ